MNNKWIERYFRVAREVSTWSKDPSKEIGAVIIGTEGQILSQGFNGFPRGLADLESRYSNPEDKNNFIVHAEMNAIYNASYSGICLKNSVLFVWGLPVCKECAKGIVQVGIKKVYYIDVWQDPKWEENFKITLDIFSESGIEIIKYPNKID